MLYLWNKIDLQDIQRQIDDSLCKKYFNKPAQSVHDPGIIKTHTLVTDLSLSLRFAFYVTVKKIKVMKVILTQNDQLSYGVRKPVPELRDHNVVLLKVVPIVYATM